jgi:uncharacterized protein (TIGR03437 family)
MRVIVVAILLGASWGVPVPGEMATEAPYFIDTIAGGGDIGDGGPARAAQLGAVEGLAVDSAGNVYVADSLDNRVRRIDAGTGIIETIAGDGHAGGAGDGGPALAAQLRQPYGLAVDGAGNVYIADLGNRRVRKVSPDGTIVTVAGGGDSAGWPARTVNLAGPRNVAVDRGGNLYVSDFAGHRVYRVTPVGGIEVVAGTGVPGYSGDGDAHSATLDGPAGLAAAPDGSLYIADSGNRRIRRVFEGRIETVAGGDTATLELVTPTGIAVDALGNLYIVDVGAGAIYRLLVSGDVNVLTDQTDEELVVRDVAVGPMRIYLGGGMTVSTLDVHGEPVRFAGDGSFGRFGDGIRATEASLDGPIGVGLDIFGNVLIVEEAGRRVRKVNGAGRVTTVAGNGALTDPVAATGDRWGRIWIADYLGNQVLCVLTDGSVHAVAGNGERGYSGDGGPARLARLNRPRGVAVDDAGNIYIADSGNHRLRRVSPEGEIVTIGGTGVRGFSGAYGPANEALFDTPAGLALDERGSLYVADKGNHRVRKIRTDGFVIPVAGNGLPGFGGDGADARLASLHEAADVAVDDDGNVWIADTNNHRIRRVRPDGVIVTAAGAGHGAFGGDGGNARYAALHFPSGIAARDGSVYVADLQNSRIRKLTRIQASPDTDPVGECTLVHGATFEEGAVAPGQIATVFGSAIGPKEAVFARIGASGTLSAHLAGTEVRFDGVPAPLFYAGGEQINLQVPSSVRSGADTTLEVHHNGATVCRSSVPVAWAAPGLFTLAGNSNHAVALNQDGSLNSEFQPAEKGSIVILYATGEGATDPPAEDGAPASLPLPRPTQAVYVRISGFPVEVLYAGSAPGFTGLMQINVRLPGGFFPGGSLPVELYVGAGRSQPGVSLWVR